MPIAQLAQAPHEAQLGDDVAALTLDRLDDDRGHLVRGHELVEEDLIEPGQVDGTAVGCVVDAAHEGRDAGPILGLGRGQGDGAHGAAVESAQERDEGMPTAGLAGELERGLHRFRTAVAQVDPLGAADGRDPGDGLTRLRVDGWIEVRGAVVHQLVGLRLDGIDDRRMRVTGGVDRDAGAEVDEEVAVDVLHRGTVAADRHEGIDARQAWRRPPVVILHVRAGARSGHLGHEARSDHSVKIEPTLPGSSTPPSTDTCCIKPMHGGYRV